MLLPQHNHEAFTNYIRHLILHDFNKLIQLLYRVDVDETKLKTLLKDSKEDAAELIARMIIDRQIKKINTSVSFKPPDDDVEERW